MSNAKLTRLRGSDNSVEMPPLPASHYSAGDISTSVRKCVNGTDMAKGRYTSEGNS